MSEIKMCHDPAIDKRGIFTPTHEIMLMVKFNDGVAFVLKEPIKLTYYRFDDTIIGTDGVFYNFYQYDWASWSHDAFGGAKFDLTMYDGEVVECRGRWWSAMSSTAKLLIDQPLVNVTAHDIKGLQDCYVYRGYIADAAKLAELRETYTGKIDDYYDGEVIIKSLKKRPGKLKAMLTCYQGQRMVVNEDNEVYKLRVIDGKVYIFYFTNIGKSGLYSEYLTQGKKDFSLKEPRVKQATGICKMCKDVAFEKDFDGKPLCHQCHKECYPETDEDYY